MPMSTSNARAICGSTPAITKVSVPSANIPRASTRSRLSIASFLS